MQDTYADTAQDEVHFRSMQVGRYTHAYSITLRVPNDQAAALGTVSDFVKGAVLQIEEDAEFHITHVSAAVMAPVGVASEVRNPDMVPAFAMAGAASGRSDRGLAFRITETGSGRRLTRGLTTLIGPNVMVPSANSQNWWWAQQGYLALESVFPPAYGFEFAAPVAFDYYLERQKRLLVEFVNRDSDVVGGVFQGTGGHRVTFCFLGQRYDA